MTIDEFRETLASGTVPTLPPLLLALWQDARGDWEKAHTLAQDIDDASGAWVHAYLHRKEGDLGNAGYWLPAREPADSHRFARFGVDAHRDRTAVAIASPDALQRERTSL